MMEMERHDAENMYDMDDDRSCTFNISGADLDDFDQRLKTKDFSNNQ